LYFLIFSHSKFHWSTARDILEKLKMQHPLPAVLLEWRRLTTILTKVVFPMQRQCSWCKHLAMNRIHGVIDLFTATGRVTMHEPNLQNIPKDIEIELLEICEKKTDLIPIVGRARRCLTETGSSLLNNKYQKSMSSFSISMRNCFVPFRGGVLVAADYSQLELRVIAHLSGDRKLTDILNQGADVFKLIASQWKAIAAEAVTCEQRQQAKQICYGIVYGIGAAALAKQLDVLEDDAAVFIESFKSKFIQLRRFLSETVQACKKNGYVKTMLGRRRYLPSINNTNHHAKAHVRICVLLVVILVPTDAVSSWL
jgi:DNA polymerase theta